MNEIVVIEEILEWLDRRIAEVPEGTYYKNLKETFEWELKTAKERLT